jgi:ribosome-binding protein aMBF1 (putative translation factor)
LDLAQTFLVADRLMGAKREQAALAANQKKLASITDLFGQASQNPNPFGSDAYKQVAALDPQLAGQYRNAMEAKQPLVNIDAAGKEVNKEAETVGEFFGKQFVETQESAGKANQALTRVNRTRQLLKQVNTGTLGSAKTAAKSLAKDLGVDLAQLNIQDDAGAAQALSAMSTQAALDFVQQTKGSISNAEMDLFAKAVPSLSRTPEGNELILEMQEKIAKNQIEVAKLAREYRKNKGRIDEGFGDVLDQYHQKNPLFTEDIKKRIQGGPTTQPGQPGQKPQSMERPAPDAPIEDIIRYNLSQQ